MSDAEGVEAEDVFGREGFVEEGGWGEGGGDGGLVWSFGFCHCGGLVV